MSTGSATAVQEPITQMPIHNSGKTLAERICVVGIQITWCHIALNSGSNNGNKENKQ